MKFISVFVKYRALIDQLVIRDIKTKYRRSILGLFWTVLNPLLMMAVLSIVFSYFFSRYGNIDNFPVYLLCGQVIFNFFNESTTIAMGSIIHSGELIKKVYVPKYLFPVSKVMSSGVNLLASMIALVIVMVVTRARVTPTVLLAVFDAFFRGGKPVFVCGGGQLPGSLTPLWGNDHGLDVSDPGDLPYGDSGKCAPLGGVYRKLKSTDGFC